MVEKAGIIPDENMKCIMGHSMNNIIFNKFKGEMRCEEVAEQVMHGLEFCQGFVGKVG